MKTITLDDKTYNHWESTAQRQGLTLEQWLTQQAQIAEDIEISRQQFAEGKCCDAREAMREIAKEHGLKFDR